MNQSIKPKPSTVLLKKIIPFLIVAFALVALLLVMKSFQPKTVAQPQPPVGMVVETTRLEVSNVTIEVESQGVVQAKRQVELVPEIQGKIVALSDQFAAGGQFKKNDILVYIDPADYKVAVERARASLAAQQANLELEQARSDQAMKDWQSFGKKQKPSDLVLNIPQLKGAKAAVAAAQADLVKAQRDLSKTEIRAPFDGVITRKMADLGQFVIMGSPLAQIAGSATAEVRLPLTDDQLTKIQWPEDINKELTIEVDFFDQQGRQQAQGQIIRLEAEKDRNTLLNYAVAQIQNPFTEGLKINEFIYAKINGKRLENVFKVPVSYVMPNNQIAVYAQDNTLQIKSFESSYRNDLFVYIASGLEPQDEIITTPIQGPVAGMKLRRTGQNVNTSKVAENES